MKVRTAGFSVSFNQESQMCWTGNENVCSTFDRIFRVCPFQINVLKLVTVCPYLSFLFFPFLHVSPFFVVSYFYSSLFFSFPSALFLKISLPITQMYMLCIAIHWNIHAHVCIWKYTHSLHPSTHVNTNR